PCGLINQRNDSGDILDEVQGRRRQTAGGRGEHHGCQDIGCSKVQPRDCLGLSVYGQRLRHIYIDSEAPILPASDNQRKRGGCDYEGSWKTSHSGYAACRTPCVSFNLHTIGDSRVRKTDDHVRVSSGWDRRGNGEKGSVTLKHGKVHLVGVRIQRQIYG